MMSSRSLTQCGQALVQHVVQGPEVWGPVGVTEAPLKGEETRQHLRELTLGGGHSVETRVYFGGGGHMVWRHVCIMCP